MIPSVVRAQIVQDLLNKFGTRIKAVHHTGTQAILGNLTVYITTPTENCKTILTLHDTKTKILIGEYDSVQKMYDALT
jgi:hypothetical protein